jgi:c-di-GMP-binding flagellar brake protein YcgR
MDKSPPPEADGKVPEEISGAGASHAHNRYAIWSRSEILHILNAIVEQNVLVSLSTEKSGDVFISSIIDIDTDNNRLVMDPAQNRAVNERFASGQQVMFEAMLDQVRVYFTAARVWHCIHKGEAGLCMHIPESIVRLQRRDYFRVHLPSSRPVMCAIPIREEPATGDWLAVIVEDLSLGGMAIVCNEGEVKADYGTKLQGCRFSLPDIGEIEADLEVRNITQITLKKGGKKIRLGCQFVSLDSSVQTKLQRYIIKLECERRAKMG